MFSFNIKKVNFEEEIGEGAHGTVYAYHQKNVATEEKYVVKRITTPQLNTMLESMQEIVLGFNCDHPNVLPIKGYHVAFDRERKLWDIFMKMPRMETSLKKVIDQYAREGKVFKEEEIVRYFYSLVLGLQYLHNRCIAHRDIKPDNILIDKHSQIRIADIGIGKLIEDENTDFLTRALGTPLYTAPEVLTRATEIKKKGLYVADIWSLGVIMAEICVPKTRLVNISASGEVNESHLAQILKNLQEQGRYNKILLDLIASLLRADPNKRRPLEEVQKVLEKNYAAVLGLSHDFSKRIAPDEENALLRAQLLDMQKQLQEMEAQMKAFRSSSINDNSADKQIKREEQKSEEKKPERLQFKGTCLKTLNYTHYVFALQLLPTGELVSGSYDNTIKLWDIKTDTCIGAFTGHSSGVRALQALPPGELASGSEDSTIKIWNIETTACIRTLTGHSGGVRALELLPTGELASGSFDKTIKLWDIKTGTCLRTLRGHRDHVYALQSLSKKELASGSRDTTIKIWDVKTGSCIKTIEGHTDYIYALQLLPTGELASGSGDKSIKLWDVKTGTCIRILTGHDDWISALQVLSTGELASSSGDNTIKLWDAKTGTCIKTLKRHTALVSALHAFPTGELASSSADKTIKLWK